MGRPPADENLPEVVPHHMQPQPASYPEVVPDTSPEAAPGQRYYMESDKYPASYDTAPKLLHEEGSPGTLTPGQQHQQPWSASDAATVSALSPSSTVPWQSFPTGGDDQHTFVGSEPEPEKRICGIRKRLFIIIAAIVGVVVIAAAVGGGVGGSTAAKSSSDAQSAEMASGTNPSTTTATSTTSSAASPSVTLLTDTDQSVFQSLVFQAWENYNMTGQHTPVWSDEGYYDIGFNATSYIWLPNEKPSKCCINFCGDKHSYLGYYCDARRKNATDDPIGFRRVNIWCGRGSNDNNMLRRCAWDYQAPPDTTTASKSAASTKAATTTKSASSTKSAAATTTSSV